MGMDHRAWLRGELEKRGLTEETAPVAVVHEVLCGDLPKPPPPPETKAFPGPRKAPPETSGAPPQAAKG